MNKKDKELEDSLIKTITLTSMLIEELDTLEERGFFRRKLKQVGKTFLKLLEKFVSDVWNTGNKRSKQDMTDNSERIQKVSSAFDEALKEIL